MGPNRMHWPVNGPNRAENSCLFREEAFPRSARNNFSTNDFRGKWVWYR